MDPVFKITGKEKLIDFIIDLQSKHKDYLFSIGGKVNYHSAYYLIKERGVSPSEACMDAGFKNYSHFSVSFKKTFGMSPSFA